MIDVVVVLLLLAISGVYSGSEVAFTSLSVDQVERFRKKKGKRGRIAASLHDELDLVLTNITIGNNLANLAASAIVSALTIRLFGEAWLTLSTVVLTVLVLIFGEVTPKQIGILHNEWVSLHMARFLRLFSVIFAPLIWIIRKISNFLTSLTGGGERPKVTAEGLRHLVGYAGSTGVLDQLHVSIVRNVLRSREVRVSAVMTHRTNIFSLERRTRVSDAFNQILESGFSRVPIYDHDPERIVGVVLLRDVARSTVIDDPSITVGRIMSEATFVPETRSLNLVLTMLQREHTNLAIVLDEYGGLAGIVTTEDLVEEFVGELYDENEIERDRLIHWVGDRESIMAGDTPIHVLHDHLDVKLTDIGDAQTLGGYIAERLGRIPRVDDRVSTSIGEFIVTQMSRSRVLTVTFQRSHRDPDEEHE